MTHPEATQSCGCNDCPRPADPDYNDRCEDHEWAQCRTEHCIEDADDGDGYDGYCGNCADRHEAAGHFT